MRKLHCLIDPHCFLILNHKSTLKTNTPDINKITQTLNVEYISSKADQSS